MNQDKPKSQEELQSEKKTKERIARHWSELTDEDLTLYKGNPDEFFRRWQDAYGYERERLEAELESLAMIEEGREERKEHVHRRLGDLQSPESAQIPPSSSGLGNVMEKK